MESIGTKMSDLCFEVIIRSCQPLRSIRYWISGKPLEIETWLIPKDHQYEMAYGVSNGHVTDNITW